MCSSTLSVNCEYVEKWAHAVRPYGRVTRLPFSYFSKQSPVSGMRQVKKQKEVGVKRVETLVFLPLFSDFRDISDELHFVVSL